jgi:hypothetical protein
MAEDFATIYRRYRAGEPYARVAAELEHRRQTLEEQRRREDAILAAADRPGADPHLLAVAQQIREHRDAGNYTTIG